MVITPVFQTGDECSSPSTSSFFAVSMRGSLVGLISQRHWFESSSRNNMEDKMKIKYFDSTLQMERFVNNVKIRKEQIVTILLLRSGQIAFIYYE